MNTCEIGFAIKRLTSSKDKDFIKALRIYNEAIPVEIKTSSNEITYFVDQSSSQKEREMYFFASYVDDIVIGFVEAAYLLKTKSIVIDYIILKPEYRLNSVFYPLFSMVLRFFSECMIDFDYIVTEVSTRTVDESVDWESFYSRKMLQMEDFRIIDSLYMQPQLGLQNEESNFQFQLMIKSTQAVGTMRTSTYLHIIQDIYFSHYLPWYKMFLTDEETKHYLDHLQQQYDLVVRDLGDRETVTLEGHIGQHQCEFYKTSDCHFKSTAGYAPTTKTVHHKAFLVVAISLVMVFAFVISLIIYLLLSCLSIPPEKFVGIFAAITAVFTGLLSMAYAKMFKSNF